MVRAVSVALLVQIGAFIIAGATLALGIDGRIDAKIAKALYPYETRIDSIKDSQRLERDLADLRSEIRLLRMQLKEKME